MQIRSATKEDEAQVWDIFHRVIQQGDTYVIPPDAPRSDLTKHWFADHMETFVLESEGKILGTYILKANQIGAGSHIANGSYMVHPEFHGKGIGNKLCEHSIEQARQLGYRGIQFNIVVSTNTSAIHLWKKFGFEIIGTTPGGFRHPFEGFVDTYIMFRSLTD